jgi:hypothetical protein
LSVKTISLSGHFDLIRESSRIKSKCSDKEIKFDVEKIKIRSLFWWFTYYTPYIINFKYLNSIEHFKPKWHLKRRIKEINQREKGSH